MVGGGQKVAEFAQHRGFEAVAEIILAPDFAREGGCAVEVAVMRQRPRERKAAGPSQRFAVREESLDRRIRGVVAKERLLRLPA